MATPTITGTVNSVAGVMTSGLPSFTYVSSADPLIAVFMGRSVDENRLLSCSFNGVPLLFLAYVTFGDWTADIWCLDAPASGSHAFTGVPLFGSGVRYCTLLFNINGATAPRVLPPQYELANGSSTTPSITFTTSRTGDLTVSICLSDIANQTFTDGGGQTRIHTNTANNTNPHIAFSSEPGAASVTTSFTLGTTDLWGMLTLVFADPGGAATVARVSRAVVEVPNTGTGTARVSRAVVEVPNTGTGGLRVSRAVVEVVTRHKFPAPLLYP